MTQANDTVRKGMVFDIFVSIMLILSVGAGFMSLTADKQVPEVNVDLGDIEARLDTIELNQVYTASGDVNIDTTNLDSAVAKMDGFKNILDDLMDEAYSTEKSLLEIGGEELYNNEFNEEDLEDFLESNIDGFDTLKDYYIDDDFGDDGVKYTILNLGLDDDEDRKILVEKQYKIKYELDDSDEVYKDYIIISGMVTYEDDEPEADITFTLV